MSGPPIACMLSGRDFKERLAWIADLNRKSLKKADRADLQLTLTYERRALKQINDLIEREQACCPFLSFGIQSDADGVRLSIIAPEDAREAADEIFKPFMGSVEDIARGAGCSCCGGTA